MGKHRNRYAPCVTRGAYNFGLHSVREMEAAHADVSVYMAEWGFLSRLGAGRAGRNSQARLSSFWMSVIVRVELKKPAKMRSPITAFGPGCVAALRELVVVRERLPAPDEKPCYLPIPCPREDWSQLPMLFGACVCGPSRSAGGTAGTWCGCSITSALTSRGPSLLHLSTWAGQSGLTSNVGGEATRWRGWLGLVGKQSWAQRAANPARGAGIDLRPNG